MAASLLLEPFRICIEQTKSVERTTKYNETKTTSPEDPDLSEEDLSLADIGVGDGILKWFEEGFGSGEPDEGRNDKSSEQRGGEIRDEATKLSLPGVSL